VFNNALGEKLVLFAKGLAMGAADVVPGVSGGTIALISGIYPTLIGSLSRFDAEALRLLGKRRWRALAEHINLVFLLTLALGVATSVLTLAQLLHHLLITQPLPVWGFFFGLIAASVPLLLRSHPCRTPAHGLLLLTGAAIAMVIGLAPPVALAPTLPILFGAGALALCAMILPGISGSFILLLLGLYPVVVAAVADRDLLLLSTFLSGGMVGLLLFSRLLRYLLNRFERAIIVLMSGFLLGSLTSVWPWRHPLQNPLAGARGTMWPTDYQALYAPAQQTMTLFAMAAGAAVLLVLELYRVKQRNLLERGQH